MGGWGHKMPESRSLQTQTQISISRFSPNPNQVIISLPSFAHRGEDLSKPWYLRHKWSVPILFGIEHEGETVSGDPDEILSCEEDCDDDDYCDTYCNNMLESTIYDMKTLENRAEGTAHFEFVTKPIALTSVDRQWAQELEELGYPVVNLEKVSAEIRRVVEEHPIMFSNHWTSAGDHIHISTVPGKARKLRKTLGNLTPLVEVMTWSGPYRSRRWYNIEFSSDHYSFVGSVYISEEFMHYEYRVPSASPIQVFWEMIVLVRDILENKKGSVPSKERILDDMWALRPVRDLLSEDWGSESLRFAWTVLLFEGVLRLKKALGLSYLLPPLLSWSIKNQLPPIYYYLKKVGLEHPEEVGRITLARYLRKVTLLSFRNYHKYSNDIFPELESERITIAEALVILKKTIKYWIKKGYVIPFTSMNREIFKEAIEELRRRLINELDLRNYYEARSIAERVLTPEFDGIRWAIDAGSLVVDEEGKFKYALVRASRIHDGFKVAKKLTGRSIEDLRGAYERVWIVLDRSLRYKAYLYSRWVNGENGERRVRVEIPEEIKSWFTETDIEWIKVAIARNHSVPTDWVDPIFINPQ